MPELPTADVVLANPAWWSLTGAHARYGLSAGRARRYDPEVSVFAGVPDDANADDWAALAGLVTADGVALPGRDIPAGWQGESGLAWQMTDDGFVTGARGTAEVIGLGPADVPEMVELVELAEPGPFAPRTIELGGYVGIRDGDRLVAMAGRRMNPPGWVEVSAVATHPDFRGRGYAAQVVRAVVEGIHASGEHAFLHVRQENAGAARVYERLGFVVHAPFTFTFAHPGAPEAAA